MCRYRTGPTPVRIPVPISGTLKSNLYFYTFKAHFNSCPPPAKEHRENLLLLSSQLYKENLEPSMMYLHTSFSVMTWQYKIHNQPITARTKVGPNYQGFTKHSYLGKPHVISRFLISLLHPLTKITETLLIAIPSNLNYYTHTILIK